MFFLFHFSFVFFKYIIKQDNLRQDIATVKNEKKRRGKEGTRKRKLILNNYRHIHRSHMSHC